MKKLNLIASGIFLLLALSTVFFALQLPPSKEGVPGPRAWPVLIAGIMLLTAVALCIKTLIKPDREERSVLKPENLRVYVTMLILIAYFIVMYYVGFCTATFFVLFVFLSWFGKHKWYTNIVTALAVTAIVYCIFKYVLKVPFRFGFLL